MEVTGIQRDNGVGRMGGRDTAAFLPITGGGSAIFPSLVREGLQTDRLPQGSYSSSDLEADKEER